MYIFSVYIYKTFSLGNVAMDFYLWPYFHNFLDKNLWSRVFYSYCRHLHLDLSPQSCTIALVSLSQSDFYQTHLFTPLFPYWSHLLQLNKFFFLLFPEPPHFKSTSTPFYAALQVGIPTFSSCTEWFAAPDPALSVSLAVSRSCVIMRGSIWGVTLWRHLDKFQVKGFRVFLVKSYCWLLKR